MDRLTSRETEILSLIAEGYTNQKIANILVVSVVTVEHHIQNLYDKMRSVLKHPNDYSMRTYATRYYLHNFGNGRPLRDVRAISVKGYKDSSGRVLIEL